MFSASENICFGIACVLASCLAISSCLVHFRAKNTGVLLMMLWTFLGLVNKGTNALAFNHNLRLDWALGCDFSAIVERSWQFGLCCSALCVLQKLEHIASLRQAHSTAVDQKRRLFIDFGIGLGLPALQIPLFFIVQPYRLNVIENVGCSAPLYGSVPALFVYHLWRLIISMVCAIFAVLILRWFLLRRRQFSAALSSQHSGLSQRKYFRLFALAICEAILISAGQFYVIIDSLRIGGLLPYTSWEQVHRDFNTIAYVPMSAIDSSSVTTLSILRWFSLTPAITLFLFFGLTEDSKSVYLSRWRVLKIFMLQCWTRGARPTQTIRSIDPHESVDLEAFESQVSKLSVLVHKDVAIN